MKGYFSIIALLLYCSLLYTQDFSKSQPDQNSKNTMCRGFNYMHLMAFGGNHITYPNELKEVFSNDYKAMELRLGWHSTGKQSWQRLHNNPIYGMGIFSSSLGRNDMDSIIGSPFGVYLFFGEPLIRYWRFTAIFDLGLGLAFDFLPYNAIENPLNDVIGSKMNLYFNGNIYLLYKLSNWLDLSLGINFYHFSNGRTNTPQRGINMGGINLGIKYIFNPIHEKYYVRHDYYTNNQPNLSMNSVPVLERYGEFQFLVSIGSVETEPGETKTETGEQDTTSLQKRYTTSTISVDYAYLILHKLKLHVGIDGMYDASMENYMSGLAPQDVDFGGKFMLGYHTGFQYLIERFTLYYSLGIYAYKESETRGNWYMRVGGRIGITEYLDTHIALKTRNGGITDWIEWGIVYKLKMNN